MIPSIDDRIASVVRALKDVILPHLPDNAPLAQEQAQLAIGHLEILRAQLDAAPQFERDECEDAAALARALLAAAPDEPAAAEAKAALSRATLNAEALAPREMRLAINTAIEGLLAAAAKSGGGHYAAMTALILEHEEARIQKDRGWNAPFGFDTL